MSSLYLNSRSRCSCKLKILSAMRECSTCCSNYQYHLVLQVMIEHFFVKEKTQQCYHLPYDYQSCGLKHQPTAQYHLEFEKLLLPHQLRSNFEPIEEVINDSNCDACENFDYHYQKIQSAAVNVFDPEPTDDKFIFDIICIANQKHQSLRCSTNPYVTPPCSVYLYLIVSLYYNLRLQLRLIVNFCDSSLWFSPSKKITSNTRH